MRSFLWFLARLGILFACLAWLFPHLDWYQAYMISLGLILVLEGASD